MNSDELATSPSANEVDGDDWPDDAWRTLPDRWGTIIARRIEGETLDRIAETFDLTRARIRQLQQKAAAALLEAQSTRSTFGRALCIR